jgi:hypothetical protein
MPSTRVGTADIDRRSLIGGRSSCRTAWIEPPGMHGSIWGRSSRGANLAGGGAVPQAAQVSDSMHSAAHARHSADDPIRRVVSRAGPVMGENVSGPVLCRDEARARFPARKLPV